MYISFNWLSDFVDIPDDFDPRELAERFTRTTAEVDSFEKIDIGARGLICGHVVAVAKVPDSANKKIATLDIGGKTIQTVTISPVLPVGANVVYAPTGASVASLGKISSTDVSGTKSEGMILPGESIGIAMAIQEAIFLPPEIEPGTPLAPELFDDWVMEVDNKSITHRPDLWGHYGIAREMAAILGTTLKPYPVVSAEELSSEDLPEVTIKIDDASACPRYSALVVTGVPTQPAPLWMQLRLGHIGLRPISGLVDLTNYIMIDLGQPMHAFDGGKVSQIEVALAKEGEEFTTLDGMKRKLIAEDLMIKCNGKSIALAGVMGGQETEVTGDTTSLLLESANFNGTTIRKTARRLNLRSDASARFEKSLDPAHTSLSIQRFIKLAQPMYPKLTLSSRLSDGYPKKQDDVFVDVDPKHVARIIGRDVSRDEASKVLSPLEFQVENSGNNKKWTVHVPSFRATGDVSIEADVIEEIARCAGYETIEPKLPHTTVRHFPVNPMHELEQQTLRYFSSVCGFNEIHGYLWYNSDWIAQLGYDPGECIEVRNAAADGLHRLRHSLMPGLLASVVKNRFYFPSLSIFEIGGVFTPDKKGDKEYRHAGFIRAAKGKKAEAQLDQDLKASLSGWLWERFGESCRFETASPGGTRPWEHPQRTATIMLGEDAVGRVSVVDLPLRRAMDEHLSAWSIAWAEIWIESLATRERKTEKPGTIPPYPLVELDFSILVDKSVRFDTITADLSAFSHPLLKQVRFVTSYEGKSAGENKRSLTFRTVVGDATRTLVDDDTNNFRKAFEKHVAAKGYELRAG